MGWERNFNGKKYYYDTVTITKSHATSLSKKHKNKGFLVRIEKIKAKNIHQHEPKYRIWKRKRGKLQCEKYLVNKGLSKTEAKKICK